MLVLGLILGTANGGVAGFFLGQSTRAVVGQNLPFRAPVAPNGPNGFPRQVPSSPNGPNTSPRQVPPGANVPNGATVASVEPNSPAAKAGLQVGDVITAVDNTRIDASHSLADLIQAHKPGDKVSLSVQRGGQTLTLSVDLGSSPDNSGAAYLGIRFAPAVAPGRFRTPGGGSNFPNG